MPEVYCKVLKRKVDGGYCAFICELPETEKSIIYNPFRGIYADCSFNKELSESDSVSKKITTVVKKSEPENDEELSLKIPQSVILKLIKVLEGDQ